MAVAADNNYISASRLQLPQKEFPPFSVLHGQVFSLLDPVRDALFLNQSTKDALGNTILDMGLGVVDNGMFFNTTKQAPSNVTKTDSFGNRLYPIKFFWLGSPKGTNDSNDNFSIFVADVDPSGFYPGAPASSFLKNPRLVLSWQQAKNDIVNWFDANYPYTTTPPKNGVGQETPNFQSNATYGTLGTGNPGNVSIMQSIDGQFWPVYDFVDNSIILYFSIKTPNYNTKAIYAYKIADSEISSPLTSSQFLGGVTGSINSLSGNAIQTTISSHRFSVISPDPLVTIPKVAGQQTAVFAYAWGAKDNVNPDHGLRTIAFIVKDIHGSPLNWNPSNTIASLGPNGFGHDFHHLSIPDKLGSIFPVGRMFASSVYGMVLNCVTDLDIRSGSNALIINKMQLRVMFFHFDSFGNGAGLMGDSLTLQSGIEALGACRPQFTTLPDGLPKIVYNVFNFDQSLKTVYEYIDVEKLKPENQKELVYGMDPSTPNSPAAIPTFGKKYADIMWPSYGSGMRQDPQSYPTLVEISTWDGILDYSFGATYLNSQRILPFRVPTNTLPHSYLLNGTNFVINFIIATVKNPGTWLALQIYGNNATFWPQVRLHD